jgi:hypothetical protein
VLVGLILAATAPRQEAIADDPADSGVKGALPADLALVSADALGFVTVRVADLWSSPLVKTFRQKLSKEDSELAEGLEKDFPKSFEQFTGAAPTEIERLTVLLSGSLFRPGPDMPMIIATKEPFDRDKIIQTLGAVERRSGGVTVYESRKRGALVRFIDDRTFVLFTPDEPLPAASPQGANSPLNEALHLAAGKHAIAGGLVPAAWLEQYGTPVLGEPFRRLEAHGAPTPRQQYETGMPLPAPGEPFRREGRGTLTGREQFETEMPLVSFLLSSHPLFLARFGSLTVDVAETPRLEFRLAYRKEVTAAVGEEVLHVALQSLQRQVRRQLRETAVEEPAEKRLIQRLLRVWEGLRVEQEGKFVRASLDVKGDLSAALAEAAAWTGVASRRVKSQNNLKMLGLALHMYHDTFGTFPPAVVTDKEGKPLYSWRVVILPFVEAENLYRQFKLDEPWDSPNNKPLLAQMPKVFAAPGATSEESTTRYQVLVGGGSLFYTIDENRRIQGNVGPPRGPRISDITDGTSNTIMVVEAAEAVPWSKPQELQYDPNGPLPKLGGIVRGGFNCVAADGAAHFVKSDTSADVLRALITKQGGEPVSFPDSRTRAQNDYPARFPGGSGMPAYPRIPVEKGPFYPPPKEKYVPKEDYKKKD